MSSNLLSPHIPENLGPEVPMKASCNLVCCCCEDDEAGQVVLDELSHFAEVFFLLRLLRDFVVFFLFSVCAKLSTAEVKN